MSSVSSLTFREMERSRRCKEQKKVFLTKIIIKQGTCGDAEVNGFV